MPLVCMNGDFIRMKHKIIILSIVLPGLTLQTCNNNPADSKVIPNASPKMNLTIGNIWVYDMYVVDPANNTTKQLSSVVKVLSDTLIDGERYSNIHSEISEPLTTFRTLAIEKNEGYFERIKYQRTSKYESRDTSVLLYKYPVNLNSLYEVNPGYSSTFNKVIADTMQVTSLNSQIKVPAGEFICNKYVSKDNYYEKDSLNNIHIFQNTFLVTYISEIGIVRQEFYLCNQGDTVMVAAIALKEFVRK